MSNSKVRIPIPARFVRDRSMELNQRGFAREPSFELTDAAKELIRPTFELPDNFDTGAPDAVEKEKNLRSTFERRLRNDIFTLERGNGGKPQLVTANHQFGRGLIKRLLGWPAYTATIGADIASVQEAVARCSARHIYSEGYKKKGRGHFGETIIFMHFEEEPDALLFSLGIKTGVTQVYKTKY